MSNYTPQYMSSLRVSAGTAEGVYHLITTLDRGGAENQLLTLVREQAKHIPVVVAYLEGEAQLEGDFRIAGAVVDHSLAGQHLLKQIGRVRRASQERIIHAHLNRAILVAGLSGAPTFVASRHNAERFWLGKPRILSSWLSRLVSRNAKVTIAISNETAKYLLSSRELSASDDVRVVHYGIDCTQSSRIHGQHKAPFQIGTIGRLVTGKDIATLLRAFQLVSKEEDVVLTVIGSGPLETELKNLALNLGISHQVTWIARTDQVMEFMKQWHVFVFPSKSEGFGLVLLEAMCAGVPIVASDASAIPEVTGRDGVAKLVPPGEPRLFATAIREALEPKVAEQMVELGYRQVGRFAASEMELRIRRIYEEVALS